MDKSYGEKKRRYIRKDGKQSKKDEFKSFTSPCKIGRNYSRSYINGNIRNMNKIIEFTYPITDNHTYYWWDNTPKKPKIYC